MVKIKICGLTRQEDIAAVNRCLPDYIGFVFYPGSKRYVSPDQAKKLKYGLSSDIQVVGVFVDEEPDLICRLAAENIIDLIQLHGQESEDVIKYLKKTTNKPIIKAVPVESEQDIRKWNDSCGDFLLFDHGSGGTGKSFHWDLIKGVKKEFFLAGGIDSTNVENAVQTGAYALDASSSLETAGFKDPVKIEKLVKKVREYGGR